MKCLFTLLLLQLSLVHFGQPKNEILKDIRYYPDAYYTKSPEIAKYCSLDIFIPKETTSFATVVWMHGGGLTGGSKSIPNELINKGFAVVSVGYRLSPQSASPAYIEDAAAAVAWVFNNIEKMGGNASKIVVSGHSAGGYLGLMITLNKQYLAKHGVDADKIAALVPFSGQAITHFTIRKERGMASTQPLIDSMAPLFFVRPDAPPILLITGDREQELLGRYEENAYLSRMLQLNGHTKTRLYELQGFDHGGMTTPAYPLLIKELEKLKGNK